MDRRAAWRARNREKMTAMRAAWLERNREAMRDIQARWYAANKAKADIATATWRISNRDRVRLHQQTRRAIKAGAPGRGITADDVDALRVRQNNHCAICASAELLTLDHVLALSKGGAHDPENAQLLCGPCNSAKGVRDMAEHLLILERRGATKRTSKLEGGSDPLCSPSL